MAPVTPITPASSGNPSWYLDPPQAPGRHITELSDLAAAFSGNAQHVQDVHAVVKAALTSDLKDWQGDARDEAMLQLEQIAAYLADLHQQWTDVSNAISLLVSGLEAAGREWTDSDSTYSEYDIPFVSPLPPVETQTIGASFYTLQPDGTVDQYTVQKDPHGVLPPILIGSTPPQDAVPRSYHMRAVLSGADAGKAKRGMVDSGPDALAAQKRAAHSFATAESGDNSLAGIGKFRAGGTYAPSKDVKADSRIPWNGGIVVQPGDNLWDISLALTGSGLGYKKLYEANKGVIGGDPNDLQPGEVLTIPPGDTENVGKGKLKTENAETYLDSLPSEPLPKQPKPSHPAKHPAAPAPAHTGGTGHGPYAR